MRLTITNADDKPEIWMVHFRFTQTIDRSDELPDRYDLRRRPVRGVICTLHPGPCKDKARPCNTPGIILGSALCSPRDQFSREVGRKIAFTRALNALPRQLRSALWANYFSHSPLKSMKQAIAKAKALASANPLAVAKVLEANHVGSVQRGVSPGSA